MNVVAIPFCKFFNIEEHKTKDIPQLPFEVFEKMDGSLGILYWLNDKPFIATRSSFDSEQALKATEILYRLYSHTFNSLDKNSTYLFEIIYPQNKIVVDYGDIEDIYLLSRICNRTGKDLVISDNIGFPIVKRYDGINSLELLKEMNTYNKEGFVVRFSNGFRVKVKFADYVRLHKLTTNVTNVTIWEYLSEEKDFNELMEKVPDEYYDWVKKVQSGLINEFNCILIECKSVFRNFESRKEAAMYFKTQKYPTILFKMLDNRRVNKEIWNLIRPKQLKPISFRK